MSLPDDPRAHARPLTGSPRAQRLLAIVLGGWALFAVACATTTRRTAPRPRPGRSTARRAPPRASTSRPRRRSPRPTRPTPRPILDEAPAEPSSLFLAREILAERAPQLDELQREGVARAVVKAEQEHGLPALLVLALIEQESHFRPKARGPGGSLGLMQLMPRVRARPRRAHTASPWQGARTLHDPVKNVHLGVLYLAEMRDAFGSADLAMAAYNIGPGAVQKRLARGKSCKGPYVTASSSASRRMRLDLRRPDDRHRRLTGALRRSHGCRSRDAARGRGIVGACPTTSTWW